MDRGTAKLTGRLRREIIAHVSLAGGPNLCSSPGDDRSARVASGGDGLERACHRGECYGTAADSQELTRIEGLLKRFFGYNEFQVIGQSQKTLKTGQEDWLATSKFFGLHVDAHGETPGGYVLNLKLYKEKELLLETEAKLSKRSPLVIKGPQVGGGQLLLVLVVQ